PCVGERASSCGDRCGPRCRESRRALADEPGRRVQRILLPHLEGRQWPVVVEMLAQELPQEALVRSHIRIIGQRGALTNDPAAQCGASDPRQKPSRWGHTRATLTQ